MDKKNKAKKTTRISKNDYLEEWAKPKIRPSHITDEQWNNLESSITMRLIRYTVNQNRFRSRKITISTTLLDADKYPKEDTIDLYHQNWVSSYDLEILKQH